MLAAVHPLVGDPPIVLHLHNRSGMGLTNVYAAPRQEVTRFDIAFGGLGGCPLIPAEKGNTATETTVAMLEAVQIGTGIDTPQIGAIAADFADCSEMLAGAS